MFEITDVITGTPITYVETLRYVKLARNGVYVETTHTDDEGVGIAANNNFYKLNEIAIKKIDYAKKMFDLNTQVVMLTDCVLELSEIISKIATSDIQVSNKTSGIVNAYLNSVITGANSLDDIPNSPVNWKSKVSDLYSLHNLSDEEEEEATADMGIKKNPTPRRARPPRR